MNNLKRLRELKDINQSKLAEKLGIGQSAISQWETGIAQPTAENLTKLADILGCTTDEILGRGENKPSA